MACAVIVVYILIGINLLEHMKVIANMREYLGIMRHSCLLPEFILHFIAIVFQCLYALMLAYYSFFVIWQSQGAGAYQNIFMNATALLFLNDISSYVCGVMKSFIEAKDEPLFLVVKQTEIKAEGIEFDPAIVFNNFYPKIYAVTSVTYSLGMIALDYASYPDAL
jgi:hypothetical protein